MARHSKMHTVKKPKGAKLVMTEVKKMFNDFGTTTGRVSSREPHLANAPKPDSVAHSGGLGPIVVVEAKPPDEYMPTKNMADILDRLSTQMSIEAITEINFDIEGNLSVAVVQRLFAKLL